MASLAGKVIIVTGAASGIGLASARLLLSRGATVALADLNYSQMEKPMQTHGRSGHFSLHALDVRNRDEVRGFVEKVKKQHGKIHGCANIAGVIGKGSNVLPIWEVSFAEYKLTIDVNTDGVFNCLAEQLKPGILEENGSVVNMASVAGLLGLACNAPYCASKFAVVGLTKSSARDAGGRGIRVNCIAPGIIQTPLLEADAVSKDPTLQKQTPIARRGQPEEVAEVVAFLLSDQSKFVTGSTYTIDGGWQC